MIMDGRTFPLRHLGSASGVVRLPQRYSISQMEPCDQNEISEPEHSASMTDRLNDMTQAILWIRQEMILLRQHDIFFKRQFLDIHDTIISLQNLKNKVHGHSRIYRKRSHSKASSNTSLHSNASSLDITLENYSVRPATSATVLNDTESDSDDHNFRPRTSSMKTTRDLAALARRRGSKELI